MGGSESIIVWLFFLSYYKCEAEELRTVTWEDEQQKTNNELMDVTEDDPFHEKVKISQLFLSKNKIILPTVLSL